MIGNAGLAFARGRCDDGSMSSFDLSARRAGLLFFAFALPVFGQLPQADEVALPAMASASGVVVRAADGEAAHAALSSVFQMNTEVCGLLGVTSRPPRYVAWYTSARSWDAFNGKPDSSSETMGLAGARSIAILSTTNDAGEPLAHEIVHLALKQTSEGPLPLWFEEGCASFFGWQAAKTVASGSGHNLVRTQPALKESELLTHDVLFGCLNYPATPGANRAFYRQSEETVRLLAEHLGGAGFHRLAVLLAANRDLHECMKKGFGFLDGDFKQLEMAVDVRATSRQMR